MERDQFRDHPAIIDRHRTSQIKRGELRESSKMADFAENGKWGGGLKIRRGQPHGGSIPPLGTKENPVTI